MPETPWLFASHNLGKIQEMRNLLQAFGIAVVSARDLHLPEVNETGESFLENALLKAQAASLHSNLPVLAEDSGLVVESLDGAPGIYSARFAEKMGLGQARNAKERDAFNNQALLEALANQTKRQACYYCVVVFLARPQDPQPRLGQGQWCGEILEQARGNGGFGYDPLFYLEKYQKTAAELSEAEKAQDSHRQQALLALLAQLFPDSPKKTLSA